MAPQKYRQEGSLNFPLEILESSTRQLPSCYAAIKLEPRIHVHDNRPRPVKVKWFRIHLLKETEIREMEDCLEYSVSPLDLGCEIKAVVSPVEHPQSTATFRFTHIRFEESLKSYASNALISNYSRFTAILEGLPYAQSVDSESVGMEIFDKKISFTYFSETNPFRHHRYALTLGSDDLKIETAGGDGRHLNLYLKQSKLQAPGQSNDQPPFNSCSLEGEDHYRLKLKFPSRIQKDTFILTCKLQSAVMNTALAQICNNIEALIETGKLDDSRAGKSWTEILLEYDRTRVSLHLALQQLHRLESSRPASPRGLSASRHANWESGVINEHSRMSHVSRGGVHTVLKFTPFTNKAHIDYLADSIPDEGVAHGPVRAVKDLSAWKLEAGDYSTSTAEEGEKTRLGRAGSPACSFCQKPKSVTEDEFLKTLRSQIRAIVQQKENTSVLMGSSKRFFLGQSYHEADDETDMDFDVLEIKLATKVKLLDFENEKLLRRLENLQRIH